jgi:hypothetical protein
MNQHDHHTTVPPILFLIFNRPDLTQRVFDRIREARPPKLFIAADGPRADRPHEAQLCQETRAVVEQVDWDCEVHTLFREQNLGCRRAVSSAIDWFFAQVEAGIILEDDCLPDLSFFPYCAELLERYRDDERVMMISGCNFHDQSHLPDQSYYFIGIYHIWGWATWRRAWAHYDITLSQWPTLRETDWLKGWLNSDDTARVWHNIFDMMHYHPIDSWAYSWVYSGWQQHGLAIQPVVNLISNLGFDERATHTREPDSWLGRLPVHSLTFPLKHPVGMIRNYATERFEAKNLFGAQPLWRQRMAFPVRVLRAIYRRTLARKTR